MMSKRKIKRKILGRIAQMTMAALYGQEALIDRSIKKEI